MPSYPHPTCHIITPLHLMSSSSPNTPPCNLMHNL